MFAVEIVAWVSTAFVCPPMEVSRHSGCVKMSAMYMGDALERMAVRRHLCCIVLRALGRMAVRINVPVRKKQFGVAHKRSSCVMHFFQAF